MSERERCAERLDTAWKELNISKTEGFAALVSYGRAAALLAEAVNSAAGRQGRRGSRCAHSAGR